MAKTIVQEYGPIYGEPVNGTVQGRPNGSVYVPISNRISLSTSTDYVIRWTTGDGRKFYTMCSAGGVGNQTLYHYIVDALSQDLASYVQLDLYSDALLTTKVASSTFTAGTFNFLSSHLRSIDYDTPQVGDTLYLVATLNNNGTPVATSSAIELELV